MMNDIVVNGIKTNNLKEIDIRLRKKAINLIIGPSGSGKSSLAYDTIAQIGLSELGAMYSDGTNEPDYEVDSYSNMLVTVPIKQLNSNNNVRSTIGTYFSLLFSRDLTIYIGKPFHNTSNSPCKILSIYG